MEIKRINTGDILLMKKKHPCGSAEFRVLRTGSDIRICCTKCGRDMTFEREKLEKMFKKVLTEKE